MAFNSAKLSQLRRERGWTQDDAAQRAGVKFGTYRDIEQGKTKDPSLEIVSKLAELFGVLVSDFIGGEHMPQPVGRPTKPLVIPAYHYKLVGTVGASAFDRPDVFDEPQDYQSHVAYPKGCFALRVVGTSCQSAGIPDGATVVIMPTTELQERKFMVVANESGYALKLCDKGKLWQFHPGDPEPTEIVLDAATRIVGVLMGGSFGSPDLSVDDLKQKPKSKRK